jgi:hypothetical protein
MRKGKNEDDADDLHNLDEMKHSETTIEDISQQKKYGKKNLEQRGKSRLMREWGKKWYRQSIISHHVVSGSYQQ